LLEPAGSAPPAQFMPPKIVSDSTPAQQLPVVPSAVEPALSEPMPTAASTALPVPAPLTEELAAIAPAAPEVVAVTSVDESVSPAPVKKAAKKATPAKKPAKKAAATKKTGVSEGAAKAAAVKKSATIAKPAKKAATKKAVKAKKPNTKALYDQIQISRTLVNAMGRLSDDDFKILEALIAALPTGAEELVLEKTADHPEWRGKLTEASRTKLDAEISRRMLKRSEVRAEPGSLPPEDKLRDKRITDIVRFIGEEPWDEITVPGQRRVVRRLNRVLAKDGSPLDAIAIYTAFISDQEKAEIEKNPFAKLQGTLQKRADGIVVATPQIPQDSPRIVSGLYHFFERMGFQGEPGHGRNPLHESIVGAMILGMIHSDKRVRLSAVRALAHLPAAQQKRAWPVFVRLADQPQIEGTILSEVLAMFERQENAELIDKVLRNPKHSTQVLREAVSALGRMTANAQSPEQRELAGKALMRAVFDFNLDKKVVIQAIRVVGESEPVDPAALFLAGLMASPDPETAEAASQAFHTLSRRMDRQFHIPSRLKRSEVRDEKFESRTAQFAVVQDSRLTPDDSRLALQSQIRAIFAGEIFPLSWRPSKVLAELQRLGVRAAENFQTALASYPQLLRSAQKIVAGDVKRKIIEQRTGLPAVEEIVPTVALLNARSTLSYVLVSGANAEAITKFRSDLKEHLSHANVRQRWGDIDLNKLADRFSIETVDVAGEGLDVGLKTAVLAQVLSGQKDGGRSAVVAESQAISGALFQEAQHYHFLNLYTPEGLDPTALVWMSAELLDELTDDLLAKFDNQALMRDMRWQGLWSEMQQLLSVSVSA